MRSGAKATGGRRAFGLAGILRAPPNPHAVKPPSMPPPAAQARDTWSERSEAIASAMARVALGDRAAFATVYRTTSAHLFGVILRIQPDRTQAEDILQDVFVNIWRNAQSFDARRSQPLTWLTSIARHRAIDALRRRASEPATVSRHAASSDGEDEIDLLAALPSEGPGPAELLAGAAEARGVSQCVGELSAEQQQCLALAYYQGLSHSEVAEHLAQPLGTVKSWVRRALMALKDCLARAGHGGA
jgi:RNA polymerase sigma-70 factor (ECF subfamily)